MKTNIEEDIYFGDNYCFLYPCTGLFRSYNKKYIHQDEINKESIIESMKYSDDLSYIKPEYKDYYIPAIPETQIHFIDNNLKEDKDFFLNQPLIKSKEIKNYTPCYKCILSGHRSAIIKDPKSGNFYRLKGCGNEDIGFNLIKSNKSFPQYNTRGSQYNCTCFRELYITEKIDNILKKINIPCANEPIGFWKYDKDLNILPNEKIKKEDIPILENKVPEIDKYCSIFLTKGERRLRTHLLNGIDIILENISKLCISKGLFTKDNLIKIKNIFPEERLPNKIETYKINSYYFLSCPTDLNFDEWCRTPIFPKQYYDSIVSCNKLKKEIKENQDLKIFLENTEKYDELYPLISEGLSNNHKTKIKIIFDKLIQGQKNGKKFFESLIDIYARIGYEAGRIKKCLQEAHINWGTYIDREDDYHSNSHANNFIILPQGNDSLLAPLDFDLSFTKEKMIILSKDADSFGEHDDSFWENYIYSEIVNLLNNLCGAPDYNYKSEKIKFRQDTFESEIRNVIKYLLCDCLLENYMKGFDNIHSEDVININQLKDDSFFHNNFI